VSTTAEYVITIENTNDTPQINLPSGEYSATEDSAFVLILTSANISDYDAEDTIGTLTLTVLDTDLVIAVISEDSVSKTITFYPLPDAEGVDTVTIKITDKQGWSTTAEYVITIENTNDTPQITLPSGEYSATEDSAFVLILTSANISDYDAEDTIGTLTLTVLDTDLVIAVISEDSVSKTITFYPLPDAVGVDTVTIKITDKQGWSTTAEYVITILNVNDHPQYFSKPDTIAYKFVKYIYTITVGDTDTNDTGFTISYIQKPDSMTLEQISDTQAKLEWIPEKLDSHTIEIQVTDASGSATIQSWILEVIDGPTPVKNFTGTSISGGTIALSWQAPDFNNVSLYMLTVEDSAGNIVLYKEFDTTVLSYIIPADSLVKGQEYTIKLNNKDKYGNISENTPPTIKVKSIEAIIVPAITSDFQNKLDGKNIYIDPINPDKNSLTLTVEISGDTSKLDYVQYEYKNHNDTEWKVMTLIDFPEGRIPKKYLRENVITGIWKFGSDNITEGLYDIRSIAYQTGGESDYRATIYTIEFTKNTNKADIVEKFDDVVDTYYSKERVAIGEDTIVRIIPKSVELTNSERKYTRAIVTIPQLVVTEDTKIMVYGKPIAFDDLVIEKTTLEAVNETVDKNGKIGSAELYDVSVPVVRLEFNKLKTSDTNPFYQEAIIELDYIDEDNDGQLDNSIYVNEKTLYPYYKDSPDDTEWKRVPEGVRWSITFDYTANKVTLKVPHFSVYTLFGIQRVPAANDLNNVVIFPNPFRPNDGNDLTGKEFYGDYTIDNKTGIHIMNIPANTTIEVYNIIGQKIRTLRNIPINASSDYGMAIWDGKDKNGIKVGSGTYLIVLTGNGQKVVKKVAVIR